MQDSSLEHSSMKEGEYNNNNSRNDNDKDNDNDNDNDNDSYNSASVLRKKTAINASPVNKEILKLLR